MKKVWSSSYFDDRLCDLWPFHVEAVQRYQWLHECRVLSFTSILCPCFGHRDHVGCANLLVLNQLGSCFRPRYLYLGEGLRTDVLCNGLIVSFLWIHRCLGVSACVSLQTVVLMSSLHESAILCSDCFRRCHNHDAFCWCWRRWLNILYR